MHNNSWYDKSDVMIDSYLRTNLASPDVFYSKIDPSKDFKHKVMLEAISCEKKRARQISVFLVIFALIPFFSREIWLVLRNDYFSLSKLPFGKALVEIYNVFVSPVTFVVFLLFGIIVTTFIYVKKWRHIGNMATVKTV